MILLSILNYAITPHHAFQTGSRSVCCPYMLHPSPTNRHLSTHYEQRARGLVFYMIAHFFGELLQSICLVSNTVCGPSTLEPSEVMTTMRTK